MTIPHHQLLNILTTASKYPRACGQALQHYFYSIIHAQVPEFAADGKTGNGRGGRRRSKARVQKSVFQQ